MSNLKKKKSLEELLAASGKIEESVRKEKEALNAKTPEEIANKAFLSESIADVFAVSMEEIDATSTVELLNAANIHLRGHPWFNHLRFVFSLVPAPRSYYESFTFSAYRYYAKCTVSGVLYKDLASMEGVFDTRILLLLSEAKLQQTLMFIFDKLFINGESKKHFVVKRSLTEDFDFFVAIPVVAIPAIAKEKDEWQKSNESLSEFPVVLKDD